MYKHIPTICTYIHIYTHVHLSTWNIGGLCFRVEILNVLLSSELDDKFFNNFHMHKMMLLGRSAWENEQNNNSMYRKTWITKSIYVKYLDIEWILLSAGSGLYKKIQFWLLLVESSKIDFFFISTQVHAFGNLFCILKNCCCMLLKDAKIRNFHLSP